MFRSPFCAVVLFYMFPFSLFCIYFMPVEKYNLFSCPESGAKVHTRPGLVSPLEDSLLLPLSFHMSASFYTVRTVLHTFCAIKTGSTHCSARHGNTMKIQLSSCRIYQMINKYYIMCNYICSSYMELFCGNINLVYVNKCGNE